VSQHYGSVAQAGFQITLQVAQLVEKLAVQADGDHEDERDQPLQGGLVAVEGDKAG